MSMLTMLALILSASICFFIPLGSLAYFVAKDKRLIKSFLIGMIIFFITQVVIRIPIINLILPNMDWYLNMSSNPWMYSIFLALTAGLVEEIGRYMAFKYLLKNNRTYRDGIACGLGHGGIEAILITGISCVTVLIGSLIGNDIFMNISPLEAFAAGFERLCAMVIQIGLSMIVLYGVRQKSIKYLFLAIFVHTLINLPLIMLLKWGIVAVEIYVFIWAIILGIFTVYSKKIYNNQKLN